MIFKLFYKTNPTFCCKIICLAESPYRSPDVSEFQGSGIRLARARDLLPSRLLDVVERRQAGHLVRLFERRRYPEGTDGWTFYDLPTQESQPEPRPDEEMPPSR